MNIFLHELRAYRKSTITWTCSLIAVIVLFLSLFPSVSKDFAQFSSVLEGYPEGVRKALGIQVETFGTLLGFYMYIFMYITLCGAIQAMVLGASILSKEVREKTADFLLTKPVTRTKIVTSKLLAATASLVITCLIYIGAAYVMAIQVKTVDFDGSIFLLISFTLLFIQLMFLSIGFIVSVVFSKIKAVLSVSLGTVFAFFVIGMIVAVDGEGAKRYFSPFKYFSGTYMLAHASYETSYVIAAIAIIVVSITASYFIYTQKDVHAV